jgi:hypothetical protein
MLTAYYYTCVDILKDHLPTIPELKLTNAKGYDGKIKYENGEYTVYLSKFNLFVSDFHINQEDINEIVDTICHEFAHMFFWETWSRPYSHD